MRYDESGIETKLEFTCTTTRLFQSVILKYFSLLENRVFSEPFLLSLGLSPSVTISFGSTSLQPEKEEQLESMRLKLESKSCCNCLYYV